MHNGIEGFRKIQCVDYYKGFVSSNPVIVFKIAMSAAVVDPVGR